MKLTHHRKHFPKRNHSIFFSYTTKDLQKNSRQKNTYNNDGAEEYDVENADAFFFLICVEYLLGWSFCAKIYQICKLGRIHAHVYHVFYYLIFHNFFFYAVIDK
jgi:hypothetical protein